MGAWSPNNKFKNIQDIIRVKISIAALTGCLCGCKLGGKQMADVAERLSP